jgi:hypothetical protein
VSDEALKELKDCFLEAYDDNKDGKIEIREVSEGGDKAKGIIQYSEGDHLDRWLIRLPLINVSVHQRINIFFRFAHFRCLGFSVVRLSVQSTVYSVCTLSD